MPHRSNSDVPTGIQNALCALEAFAALMHCVDPARFASIGRPTARGMGTLLFYVHSDLEGGLKELDLLPPAA